jgi:hypothetical protein
VTLKVVAEGWQVELFIWSLTHAATYLVVHVWISSGWPIDAAAARS